ncbi:Ubiquitin-like-specific protease 1 [Phytophthora citrophthora]|uniref:Ubiquitin-like-specific protease 1 n=1 Tax=Phytophthora citrophthora TaxID=4793 RepID=A0AAD9LC48_9STRA|nr:Ubiquitin-like-specific protease 1 [Phytophthora citrophthora]
MKNAVLNRDAFYVLPPKLLAAYMAILPVANTHDSAISVDDPASQASQPDRLIDTVQINDIGSFSCQQIEIFKLIDNVKVAVELGIELHVWLTEEGRPALPAQYHGLAQDVATDILNSYPDKGLEGLANHADYKYTLLYRAQPPTWLMDAAIQACCERFIQKNNDCCFAGFVTGSVSKKRTRTVDGSLVGTSVRERLMSQIAEQGVDTVFLPINFMNAHWCCIVVKVQAKRIYFYDPLGQAPYKNACSTIATRLKVTGLQEYEVIAQNNPIQFDAFSCGVYVCWMFIRLAVRGLRVDINATALPKRRFELFYFLKTGRLLADEPEVDTTPPGDDGEDKAPPPSQDQEVDQLPATQVAQ